ncbi:MAG TPA: hypothetical protein VGF30_15060 [Bacteroidia bacterium]
MIVVTFNDSFSGIYKSQVLDVCRMLQDKHKVPVKLLAFVSLRNYSAQRKQIKANYEQATVLPMFPKVGFWRWNIFLFFWAVLFLRDNKIWARGPFAANLAVSLKKTGLVKKVIFDARGAYQAELTEYSVIADATVVAQIEAIEKRALNESTAQLAVSEKLREWWKQKYSFIPSASVVIPCTLSSFFVKELHEGEIAELRKKNGYGQEDIVIVYSGSSAGWQSFELIHDYLFKQFQKNEQLHLIFMSDQIPDTLPLFKEFGNRVSKKWVKPGEVRDVLLCADYGLLIREESVTNYVSSPVKFAEYLSCGLQVIISGGIGDFTGFVREHRCGFLFNEAHNPVKPTVEQKKKANSLALQYFSKDAVSNTEAYAKLLTYLE